MDPVRVIAGCTHRAGLLDLYERQLGAAGIPLCMEISPKLKFPKGLRMMGDHVDNLSRWLDKHGDCENLIFTDAWDVLFYGSAEDVVRKIPAKGVLLGAERNCWPDVYLADEYAGENSWKYLNGGLLAAKPENLARWLDSIKKHPAYHPGVIDQQWLNHRLLENCAHSQPLVDTTIDRRTSLFYCMIKEAGELQFEAGQPVNTISGTKPNFVHFNGKYDSTMFLWRQATSEGRKVRAI